MAAAPAVAVPPSLDMAEGRRNRVNKDDIDDEDEY
jgi:hypothetical protein